MKNTAYIKKKMGNPVDYGDFIIIRPKTSYRMNSGVILIKGKEPIIIDTGSTFDPGMKRIRFAFNHYKINPNDVKYIIITHSHQDHSVNLWSIEKYCKNAKVICHANTYPEIKIPVNMSESWGKSLKMLGKSKFVQLINGPLSILAYMLFYRTIHIYQRIDYATNYSCSAEDFKLKNCPKLTTGSKDFKIIPTIGHSTGHICVLDSDKNLYLGDFVPFTPWINPDVDSLDNMINSIKIILKLDENEVKYAVRSHGDYRRDSNYQGELHDNGPWYSNKSTWEVAPWSEEKARFKYWLEKIECSLKLIPKLLQNKPLNTFEITEKIIPHFKKYSFLMDMVFIPPAITWILAYCLKLEQIGKIKKKFVKDKLYWELV